MLSVSCSLYHHASLKRMRAGPERDRLLYENKVRERAVQAQWEQMIEQEDERQRS
jgi:hypothetical protein